VKRRVRKDYKQRADGKWNVWHRVDLVERRLIDSQNPGWHDATIDVPTQGEWVLVAVCNTPEEAKEIWRGLR
jgi:hypothetical protein